MRRGLSLLLTGLCGALLVGCTTPLPPGAEPGPNNTMAYTVLVEASEPGARIEVNGEAVGQTPINIKIFGDPDGTFHDFGSAYFEVRALPLTTNQYAQVRHFGTGQMFGREDRIPQRIYFDMNSRPPEYVPYPVYIEPSPFYYDPYPFHYRHHYYHRGPSLRFHFGGHHHFRPPHHRWR